jgi:glycosyltransferase involved in cell wall biosynthesis
MLKVIVNCGACEEFIARCLDSLRSQCYTGWQAYVTVDPWGDRTFERALAAGGRDGRIRVIENRKRRYAMRNLIAGVERSGADPEDIVVVLDGDDWLATPHALRILAETYAQYDCWMTYGSWIADEARWQGIQRGMWPAYAAGTTDFRKAEWRGTALRTWKRWLWERIDDSDFRDGRGNYFAVTEDRATMLPMLEMSGTGKARHIAEALMVYNRSNPQACGKTRYDEMISNAHYLGTRRPYARLNMQQCWTSPFAGGRISAVGKCSLINSTV